MSNTKLSDYWLDSALFNDDGEDGGGSNLRKIIKLAAVRRSISNFVSIVSGQNIPVVFSSGQQSYTDGESVVIAADDNPDHFDHIVGLALHEGAHVLLSDFEFLKRLSESTNMMLRLYDYSRIYDILPESITKYFTAPHRISSLVDDPGRPVLQRMIKDICTVMNILEDRRIDKYVYNRAPGYRGYYDALYKKYFFTTAVGKNLKHNRDWNSVTVDAYMNRLIMLFHPDNDHTALPGFEDIVALVDLENIDRVDPDNDPVSIDSYGEVQTAWVHRWNYHNSPILFQEACKVYAKIIEQVGVRFPKLFKAPALHGIKDAIEKNLAQDEEESEEADTGAEEADDKGPESSLPNMDDVPIGAPGDDGPPLVDDFEEGKHNPRTGDNAIDKARSVMEGTLKKKKVSKKDNAALDALNNSNVNIVGVKGDGLNYTIEVINTENNSPSFVESSMYAFNTIGYNRGWSVELAENAISDGRKMGAILSNRLQIRTDDVFTKNTRLRNGKIDKRLLATLGAGATNVFHKVTVDKFIPAMLHLSIDASSSMAGTKWFKTITVATALAYLSKKVQNIDVTISFRGTDRSDVINSKVFDSRKHSFSRWQYVARNSTANGSTPESLCFSAAMKDIIATKTTHKTYFINFSDGAPGCGRNIGYGGPEAIKHCRNVVNRIKDNGVSVLSYFITEGSVIGASEHTMNNFKQMYGANAAMVDVKNATAVLNTLNTLLMER